MQRRPQLPTLLVPLALALTLLGTAIACQRSEPTAKPAADETAQGAATAPEASPETALGTVTVGGRVDTDGAIPPEAIQSDFQPGEPVYVSVEIGDAEPGSTVRVVWYDPEDVKMGEQVETVAAGQPYLSFQTPSTDEWKSGEYRAEIWFGNEMLDEVEFGLGNAGDDSSM